MTIDSLNAEIREQFTKSVECDLWVHVLYLKKPKDVVRISSFATSIKQNSMDHTHILTKTRLLFILNYIQWIAQTHFSDLPILQISVFSQSRGMPNKVA